MNPLNPLIEQLAGAVDDAARAQWLLKCPISILMTYQSTIRNRLLLSGFAVGVAYFDFELSACRAVRECGLMIQDNPLRQDMLQIAGFVPAGD
jgi:hypothetical protein